MAPSLKDGPKNNKLTLREFKMLMSFANGHNAKEVAHAMEMDVEAVRAMAERLKRRFNAFSMPHMVYIAMRKGLII